MNTCRTEQMVWPNSTDQEGEKVPGVKKRRKKDKRKERWLDRRMNVGGTGNP